MHAPLVSTSMLRIPFKKTAIASLVALSTILVLTTGCKKPAEAADQQVSADIVKAQQDLKTAYDKLAFYRRARLYFDTSLPADAKGPATAKPDDLYVGTVHRRDLDGLEKAAMKDLETAVKLYQESVKNSAAADWTKSNANIAAGNAESLLSDIVLAKIDGMQAKLERVLGIVSTLAAKVQANNVMIKGLTAQDPKPTLADLDKKANDAKTGAQGVWIPSDKDAAIPALAAADKQIADQSQVIDAQKSKLAELEKQRADALKQAERLSMQSDATRGKAALDLFTQSSNARKAAGDLSTQIQDNEAKLAAAQRELSVAQAQQAQLTSVVTLFAAENKQVSDGWDVVKKRMDDVTAKSRTIVEGDPAAAPAASGASIDAPIASIAAAGDQVDKISQELDKLRAEAKDHLDKADAYYDAGLKLNKGVAATYNAFLANGNLKDSPQRPAWQWMVEIHNETDPNLQRAIVQERFARLYADNFYYSNSALATENVLATVLGTASVAVPKTLEPSDKLKASVKEASDNASRSFTEAEKYLAEITDKTGASTDTSKALVQSATVLKLFEQYGRYAFAKSMNDPSADSLLSSAKTLAAALAAQPEVDLPLPLPPEIAPPPSATSAAASAPPPTTSPSGAPATPVADTPDQAAVRTAYKDFMSALLAPDAAKAKTMIVPDPGTETDIDMATAMFASMQKLMTALVAKFPGDAAAAASAAQIQTGFAATLQSATSQPITINGDTATVAGAPPDPDPQPMTRVNGVWKVAPTPASPRHTAENETYKKVTAAVDGVTAELEAGKFATSAAFGQELIKAITAASAGAPAAPATPAPATPAPAAPAPATPGPATPAPAAPEAPAPAIPAPASPAPAPPATPPATPAAPETPATTPPAAPATPPSTPAAPATPAPATPPATPPAAPAPPK